MSTVIGLPDLASQINLEHASAMEHAQSAVRRARKAGELLLQAKEGCQHGAWLPWLATNCPAIPERTAQAYMRLARHCLASPDGGVAIESETLRDALTTLAVRKPATVADLMRPDPRIPFEPGFVTVGWAEGDVARVLFESVKHPGYWHDYNLLDGTVSVRPMRSWGFSHRRDLLNVASWQTERDTGWGQKFEAEAA